IRYRANATAESSSSPSMADGDNLTILAPFAGGVPGVLNLVESLRLMESGGGGSVSLAREETHTLNIPIEVDSASSLCASTLGSLGAVLSRSPCNATLEQAAFDSVLPGLVADAAAKGFTLTAGWGSSAGCSTTYWVTLAESGVAGAMGRFDWTVRGSGTSA
ncbi:MAG TPA: hypothetical protein VGS04_05195, partial [Nitrososphaerales archaeon]|nr:hypothetical protein [Nitrososphaerales archaeon]